MEFIVGLTCRLNVGFYTIVLLYSFYYIIQCFNVPDYVLFFLWDQKYLGHEINGLVDVVNFIHSYSFS
jgi:hypothetical protein